VPRPRRASASLRAALLAAAVAFGAPPARAFELEGAWHVLVHYRDLRSALPDQLQWEDRLWVFERDGEGLRLREYPIVAFEDEGGRFETDTGGERRTLGAWEPSPGQRREIERGLRVVARGALARRLAPTASGFATRRAAGGYDSARYVTFESSFEVDLSGEPPRFVATEALGSQAVAEAIQGRTEYRGERVLEGGRAVEGRYERDGRRVGRFVLTRAGPPRGVAEPGPAEEPGRAAVEARFYRELGRQLGASEALPERYGGGEAGRAELRERLRAELARRFEDQGNDPRAHAGAIERLAAEIERAYAEAGRTRGEIGRMIEDGRLRP
jgi:hypothetical protein